MTFNPKLSPSDGLDHLADRLDPIIAAKFITDLASHPWTVILNHLDQVAGSRRGTTAPLTFRRSSRCSRGG